MWLGRGTEPGLYRAIAEKRDLVPYVRLTGVTGLEIIAGSRELAALDDLRGRMGIQTALKRALAKLGEDWDVVLVDCPPNLGLLAVNALAATWGVESLNIPSPRLFTGRACFIVKCAK